MILLKALSTYILTRVRLVQTRNNLIDNLILIICQKGQEELSLKKNKIFIKIKTRLLQSMVSWREQLFKTIQSDMAVVLIEILRLKTVSFQIWWASNLKHKTNIVVGRDSWIVLSVRLTKQIKLIKNYNKLLLSNNYNNLKLS